MLIEGSFDAAHIVREFLAREYAFSCIYSDILEVRIAHRKGVWNIAKLMAGNLVDFLVFGDDGFVESANPLLKGLAEEKALKHVVFSELVRASAAQAIAEVISIWVGDLKDIEKIVCLQKGRNATLNPETGKFSLSPRPTEWKY